MKLDVICDTNIWYNIGNGVIKPEDIEQYSLIATFYNFEELLTSHNLLKNFHNVRRAAKAIVTYSSKQILENGFLHLAKIIDPHFEDTRYNYNLGLRNWNEVRAIARQDESFTLSPESEKEYLMNIQSSDSNSNNVARLENRFVNDVKGHSKELKKKNERDYLRKRLQGIVFELNDQLKQFSYGKVQLQRQQIKLIELFVTTSLQFSRGLEIGGMVVKPNDIYDLYNMIYTKPGMKYFTFEKKWIRMITEGGLSDYLVTLK
jgi:hypothetical protein